MTEAGGARGALDADETVGTDESGPSALRTTNRALVLDLLGRSEPLSRGELIRRTGLSRSTVSSIVKELMTEGHVAETSGEPAPKGSGRPPTRLTLAGDPRVLVGVDIGHRHVRVAVSDLASHVLSEREVAHDVDREPAAPTLDLTARMVRECLAEAGADGARVVGVGMGVPGPIDPRTGTIVSPILPSWVTLQPSVELADRLGLDVRTDNDANVGALGELVHGAARGHDDVIYVKVAGGIGAGLILAGRLHRGVTGIAGEIGHVRLDDDGPVCRCGNRGCLETQVAAPRLVELLRPAYGAELDVERMLELSRADDAGVNRILDDAGRAIGRVLADLSNHLNPAVIVVGGAVGVSPSLMRGIRDSVARYAQPDTASALRVIPGSLGEHAGVMGALALAKDVPAVAGLPTAADHRSA
jgi:predicted NBD/HSP70 family sugar kinase/DNA-binding transcriptional ArsR family regulator